MLDNKIELIEKGAIIWGQQNQSIIKQSETECFTDDASDVCFRTELSYLLSENAIEADEKTESGEKIIKNPTTNNSINNCPIEIYIKNRRVYAKYDSYDVNCYYTQNESSESEETIIADGSSITFVQNIKRSEEIKLTSEIDFTSPTQDEESVVVKETYRNDEEIELNTYFYRGDVKNNFLNFAGMCWRIVRIEDNGSIKIILADENNECNSENYENNGFITGENSATYYSIESDLDYDNSQLQTTLNSWLNSKINASNKELLLKTKWCNEITSTKQPYESQDKAYLKSDGTLTDNKSEAAYVAHYTLYTAAERLYPKETAQPRPYCNESDLTDNEYYVGLLTADELVYAGAVEGLTDTINANHYLTNDNHIMWTMTAAVYMGIEDRKNPFATPDFTYNMLLFIDGVLSYGNVNDGGPAARPVVILKPDVEINIKNRSLEYGLQNNPYIVKSS